MTGGLPDGTGDQLVDRIRQLVLSGSLRVLVPARCVSLAFGILLIGLVYLVARRLGGSGVGLIAAAIVALVPEVAAHSAIAGSDMPFTVTAFLALMALARYVESPTAGRWVALALSIGLAWAMRHTAIVLLPLAFCAHAWVSWRQFRPRTMMDAVDWGAGTIWATAGLGLVAFTVLWAGDGLALVSLQEIGQKVTLVRVPHAVGAIDFSALPVPSSLLSILKQIRHQNAGHEAFFLGEFGTTGWPLYFPVAFLLKTPLGLLGLMVLAVACVRPRATWEYVALVFLALLWVMLVRNKVNIGLRYALLTYPIAAVFIARLFEPELCRDRVRRALAIMAAAGFAWASISCGSRCLSYFNEIGGGTRMGGIYLSDSNLDWGQDFDRLAESVSRLGLNEVTTDLLSERQLVLPGVASVANPAWNAQMPDTPPPNRRLYDAEGGFIPVYTRYVAVSASKLVGLYSHNDMSWLLTRRLVERVGDSIFLFDLDEPASGPLFE